MGFTIGADLEGYALDVAAIDREARVVAAELGATLIFDRTDPELLVCQFGVPFETVRERRATALDSKLTWR